MVELASIYLQARLTEEKQCILVLIGATPEGRKELIGSSRGLSESCIVVGPKCWHRRCTERLPG